MQLLCIYGTANSFQLLPTCAWLLMDDANALMLILALEIELIRIQHCMSCRRVRSGTIVTSDARISTSPGAHQCIPKIASI